MKGDNCFRLIYEFAFSMFIETEISSAYISRIITSYIITILVTQSR